MFRRFARMAIAVPFLAAIFLSACTATLPQPARDTSTRSANAALHGVDEQRRSSGNVE